VARWSEVSVQDLGGAERIDAEYYDPELLSFEIELDATGWTTLPLGEVVHGGARVVSVAPRNIQDEITERLQDSLDAARASQQAYAAADALAAEVLPTPKDEATTTWIGRLDEVEQWERMDAEYFQPAKWDVQAALLSQPHLRLDSQFVVVRDLFNPLGNRHAWVRNYDVTDAFTPFLDNSKDPVRSADVRSVKLRFQPEDLVISRLRSYLRQIALVTTEAEPPPVGSSEFIVLRRIGNVSVETLLVFLRSPAAQTILKWSQDGSNHPRFDTRMLLQLPIPQSLHEHDRELKDLVRTAIRLRQRAEERLQAAVNALEASIE
jgi:hypothetical protein